MTDHQDFLLNAEDVAKLLGIRNPRAVYARMRRADVPEWRDGRTVRWWHSDVIAYMRRGTLRPASERSDHPEGPRRPWERAS